MKKVMFLEKLLLGPMCPHTHTQCSPDLPEGVPPLCLQVWGVWNERGTLSLWSVCYCRVSQTESFCFSGIVNKTRSSLGSKLLKSGPLPIPKFFMYAIFHSQTVVPASAGRHICPEAASGGGGVPDVSLSGRDHGHALRLHQTHQEHPSQSCTPTYLPQLITGT